MILLILGVVGAQTVGSFLKNAEVKCLIEENHTKNEEEYLTSFVQELPRATCMDVP